MVPPWETVGLGRAEEGLAVETRVSLGSSRLFFANQERQTCTILEFGNYMAIARCVKCGRPEPRSSPYVASHTAQPNGGNPIVCGAKGCEQPAMIWLTTEEQEQYLKGRRIFAFATNAAKVRIT